MFKNKYREKETKSDGVAWVEYWEIKDDLDIANYLGEKSVRKGTGSKANHDRQTLGRQLQRKYIVTEPKHWQQDQKPQGKHVKKICKFL